MRDAARRAVELSRGKEVGGLDPDDETALALARLLEILGEAAARAAPELRERHPEIPWRDIADTRNRVIHKYFDIDLEIVGAIVRDDLPALVGQLEAILNGIAKNGEGDYG
jgi:uncharacterized protein with HEPN domain